MTTPTSPRPAELEASLEQYFRRRVRMTLGGMCIKMAPTTAGLPDRMVVLPGGRIRLVELKTSTGRLSAIQVAMHHTLALLGVEVAVLYGRSGVDAWLGQQFPTDAELGAYRGRGSGGRRASVSAAAKRAKVAAQ